MIERIDQCTCPMKRIDRMGFAELNECQRRWLYRCTYSDGHFVRTVWRCGMHANSILAWGRQLQRRTGFDPKVEIVKIR